ncbi:MAG: NAD-dependent 4,6-dehydratase LegB [Desulfitobacteriaceae bacterium]|nr:NAD-dependent 4,6-dehydratase LegB [Desulfitobacteriaceae bacterium]MDI6879456.1 NAD-dependent 4,6-dehydratase LegB [Desulfitobacteriaceae bacterium]MDI6912950.1 NAD-dependent 4,6-dehydratase LegB [Desulfitobacteriaceae bacterium]
MQRKTVLVTGAEGFIGSHLTETLVRKGHKVRAFVYYNSFNSWGWLDTLDKAIQDELEIFAGDIRDPFAVHKAVEGCNVLLHLAALIAIPYSYQAPAAYVETNVTGTLNILQAARACGVEKVVHTSTSEVYGTAKYVPMDEDHPLQAQSPYAATKIAADQLAFSFHRSFGLPVAVIRPFNTYGPRQSARAVIPTIIAQIAAGKEKIKLGALEPTRDMNYVKDTVSGLMAVASSEKSVGEVINIGSNYEISIGDLARLIAEVMGRQVIIETEAERLRPEKSEVERLWADNSKAKQLLGWEPAYAGLDGLKRGLEDTAGWFSDPENLKHYKADIYNL